MFFQQVAATGETFCTTPLPGPIRSTWIVLGVKGFLNVRRAGSWLVLFPQGEEAVIAEFPEGVQEEDA